MPDTTLKPREPGLYEKHAQTILLGITTAAILGCFRFLWGLSITVTQMQEQNMQRTIRIDNVQQSVNELQLDMKTTKAGVQDVRERMIRVEEHDK